jgi:hypothetical protein
MSRQSDEQVALLKQQADDRLLQVLGPEAYMQTCALMVELEQIVEPLGPTLAAEALASFNTLLTWRYVNRRRHG